ncbi:MAG: hypothetical protein HEP71_06750 [Roseivirga sp.]|nr:hypothetical protein [Roseivirga sp.]
MSKAESIVECPDCASDNVAKSRKPASIVAYLLLLIGLPLPIFKKKQYHCFECGLDFKVSRTKKE